jgi:hypothetical protein
VSLDLDLVRQLKRLKLGQLVPTLPERLALARAQQLDYAACLTLLLADEVQLDACVVFNTDHGDDAESCKREEERVLMIWPTQCLNARSSEPATVHSEDTQRRRPRRGLPAAPYRGPVSQFAPTELAPCCRPTAGPAFS